MTEFFSSVRGALSVYCSSDDGQLTDARFVLARFGEDPDKVVAASGASMAMAASPLCPCSLTALRHAVNCAARSH